MDTIQPAIASTLVGTLLLALAYVYLYVHERDRFLLICAAGWGFYVARLVIALMFGAAASAWSDVALIMNGAMILYGYRVFAGQRTRAILWIATAVACAYALVAAGVGLGWYASHVPVRFFTASLSLIAGASLLRGSKEIGPSSAGLVAWTLVVWGFHQANYPWLGRDPTTAYWGFTFSTVLIFVLLLGTLFLYFDRARAKLVASEARYRSLTFDLPVTICSIRPDGVVDFANDTRGEWAGRPFAELVAPASRGGLTAAMLGLSAASPVQTLELAGHETSAMQWTIRAHFDPGGTLSGYQAVGQDVTMQRRIAQQTEKADKLQSLGRLAGGVAHAFNNQLVAIAGYAEMLRDAAKSENEHTIASRILSSAQHSKQLVQQLLAFGRKGRIHSEPMDLHAVIKEVASIVGRSSDPRVRLELDFVAESAVVVGDKEQLQGAILALVLNARDAMPHGGELRIVTKVLRLRSERGLAPGDYLEIAVSDTGEGLDELTRKNLFEPFFTTKGVGRGTGLGLAAVYGTMTSHQGSVEVDSSPSGTVIRASLPLAALALREQVRPALGARGAGMHRGARILVVDDQELVREATSDLLKSLGYEVEDSGDATEAVALYSAGWKRFDLVLLDVVMPRMRGDDVLREMRRVNPNVRAVFASGYGLDELDDADSEGAVRGRLQKPFTVKELSEAIERALD